MNWLHKTIYQRGDFLVTPYELISFVACGVMILGLCLVVLIFG